MRGGSSIPIRDAIGECIREIAPDVEFYDAWKGVPETGERIKAFLRKHSG